MFKKIAKNKHNYLVNFFAIFFISFIAFFFEVKISKADFIKNSKLKEVNKIYYDYEGFVNFSSAISNQNNNYEKNYLNDNLTKNYVNHHNFIGSDSQIFFEAKAKNQNNSQFGAIAKFQFNYNSNKRNEALNLDQNYLFFENENFGKLEFGNFIAANQYLKEGSHRVTKGSGGINGKYLEHVNLPVLANSNNINNQVCVGDINSSSCKNIKLPKFILLAQSPIAHGGSAKGNYSRNFDNNYHYGNSDLTNFNRSNFRSIKENSFDGIEDAAKITYFSPRIEGFKIGVSYAPDSSYNGLTKNVAEDVDYKIAKNIFSTSLNYANYFNNLFVAFSASAEAAKVNNSASKSNYKQDDLLAYDFGLTASYFGFEIGLNYGIWKKYFQAKEGPYSCNYNENLNLNLQNCSINAKKFENPYYVSGAIAYEFGPFSTSLSALRTNYEANKYSAISLDLGYKIKKDLNIYFSSTKFDFEINQPKASGILNQDYIANSQRSLQDNRGYVFLTGILFSF